MDTKNPMNILIEFCKTKNTSLLSKLDKEYRDILLVICMLRFKNPMCKSVIKYYAKRNEITPEITKFIGFTVIPNFINNEKELLSEINKRNWSTVLSRRVQHYGYEYVYRGKSGQQLKKTSDIPDFIKDLGIPGNQVIINEYEPGQGIAGHIDNPKIFGDVVYGISLGSQCTFVLSYDDINVGLIIPRKSLLIMEKEARYDWKHGIDKRKTDIINGNKVYRGKRVSVTIRNTK